MRIDRIDLFRVAMPLIAPWRTAYGGDAVIESVLVQMASDAFPSRRFYLEDIGDREFCAEAPCKLRAFDGLGSDVLPNPSRLAARTIEHVHFSA